jgi:hypothetical protein
MNALLIHALALLATFSTAASLRAGLELSLPLARTAYQTNEEIPLTVVRQSSATEAADDLFLILRAEDGGQLRFTWVARQSAAADDRARAAEHLRINGRLLRPGAYAIEVSCGSTVARTNFTLHSHIRRSQFKLINWGRVRGPEQLAHGEANLGFNIFYGQPDVGDDGHLIRAGVDFIPCCVMSGGHQMDLRQECDWSDPYVIRGGTRRATRHAFAERTRPNLLGIHFYDEPGLTWAKDLETGEMTPHAVPWQHRSYEAAYGRPPIGWKEVNPGSPVDRSRWEHWARWKLGLLDAAWQDARFGVNAVAPDLLSLTQSQYGYSAFTDGYYFNVVRSLPITSGHGGYHDFGPGYFNPAMFLEFARAGDLAKPNWYLPTWYKSTTADQFRAEQYLSFQCGLQGMISPPDLDLGSTPERIPAAQGIVESNHLLQRIGPIFNSMTATRPPVALLYSLSQFLHAQTLDRKVCYAHDTMHGRNVMFTYLAGKLLQHQFLPLADEEVMDGTLAAHHRAVILTSVDYLHPDVVAALEHFASVGGLVLATADSTVRLNGAVKLEVSPAWPDAARISELTEQGNTAEASRLTKLRQALAAGEKIAAAIKPHLENAGIHPPLASSAPGIVVTRHVQADLEYLFAVNATHDGEGDPMLGLAPVTATLSVSGDGRPIYDAVHGGAAIQFQRGADPAVRQSQFHFGPGQMRVFARTARPIGGIRPATPRVQSDFARAEMPLSLEWNAVVLDESGNLLSGPIPMHITITDAHGARRFDLYRATSRGVLNISLPLALNDPPGDWKITVTELLNRTAAATTFRMPEFSTCSAAAGALGRAVCWPADRDRIFRFFRTNPAVTIVTGTNATYAPVVQRLTRILKPWNVACTVMPIIEASKPRSLTEDEARTWCGLEYASSGQIQPGSSNSPAQAGFAIRGPAILLGTPADNNLIRFIADQRFLPFQPDPLTMPGPGRGYISWQREALGVNQESITLIAYDDAGMEEAVGTLYEMLAGIEPLSPLVRPNRSTVTPTGNTGAAPELLPVWSIALPDRVTALRHSDAGIEALTHAGTLTELTVEGHPKFTRTMPAEQCRILADQWLTQDAATLALARRVAPRGRLVKLAAQESGRIAVAYWGGFLEIRDLSGAVRLRYSNPQDITAMVWNGPQLIMGDADGRLSALRAE